MAPFESTHLNTSSDNFLHETESEVVKADTFFDALKILSDAQPGLLLMDVDDTLTPSTKNMLAGRLGHIPAASLDALQVLAAKGWKLATVTNHPPSWQETENAFAHRRGQASYTELDELVDKSFGGNELPVGNTYKKTQTAVEEVGKWIMWEAVNNPRFAATTLIGNSQGDIDFGCKLQKFLQEMNSKVRIRIIKTAIYK